MPRRPVHNAILPYLGAAARDARHDRGRHQVHVAVELGARSDSTIRRFERGEAWPRDPDAMVQAYARDLDLDPVEIWKDAVARWEAERS